MIRAFFEDVHRADSDYPYYNFNMKNITYMSHFHSELELAFVAAGNVEISCRNRILNAEAGDIFIAMPGEIHSFSTSAESLLYIIKIMPRTEYEKIDFSAIHLENNIIKHTCPGYMEIINAIQTIKKESAAKKCGFEFVIRSCCEMIFAAVLRELPYTISDNEERKKTNDSRLLLNSVMRYISKHYSEEVTLDDISDYCGLSKYYFSHRFKEITGITFIEYLMTYRIEKSIPLLRLHAETITAVALECGFGNVRSYNRMFKKIYNVSPTNFFAEAAP